MDYRIVWSPTSRDDLKSIVSFMAEENPAIAEKYGLKIIDKVEQAAVFPESGRVVPEFSIPTIRELLLKPYRIVYRVNQESKIIDVSRIWHSKRGIPEL